MVDKYHELYDRIPVFECKPGCADCCGPVPFGKSEYAKIPEPVLAEGIGCPYIGDGGCSIYEVRPFLCRIYGTVEDLKCPHGCGPEKLFDVSEGKTMLAYYKILMREDR
jgi:hypothetical protein